MTSMVQFVRDRIAEVLHTHEAHHAPDAGHPDDADRERLAELRELHENAGRFEAGFFGPTQSAEIEAQLRETAAGFSGHPDYREDWQR
ncbi:hypothetical protein [Isoptericola aurantiacus]|uniref:hypothetical protein n=1 Tax=Isoptericola aurantiacus TaxID=3377839 RepID=UPI003839E4C0